ncbi:MAG: polysaccharide deacetylase family protein [Chloroflexi bacterium]|nr:polysaccharide deacetylase family protein [Chloroflexota bacterium]
MPTRAINITFHGIGSPPQRVDADEEAVWTSTEEFEFVLDAARAREDVRITFDDGNRSDLEIALPALRARGLRATFFVVAGRVGTPGYVDADAIRELAEAGMGIGCHGMRHRPWRGLTGPALHEELGEARAQLERIVGVTVDEAACPFGAYDRRSLAGLRAHGYRRVYTCDRGSARPDLWLQARNTVYGGQGATLVDGLLARGDSWRVRLARDTKTLVKRWR